MNSTKDKENKSRSSTNAVAVGIDLGTTYSAVAWNGKIVSDPDSGAKTFPSVIAFNKDDGKKLFGQQAVNQMITNPEGTIVRSKTLMGLDPASPSEAKIIDQLRKEVAYKIETKNGVKIVVGKENYPPQTIATLFLGTLKSLIETSLGKSIGSTVITVPAYFNDAQRQATKEAAENAGLKVLRIINEPTAAAIAYGIDKETSRKKTVAVFDLGGGTFDISILTIDSGIFEVKATNGNTFLGGTNFDQEIFNYLIREFKNQNPTIDIEKDKSALQRIREAAEKVKRELSFATEAEVNLPYLSADASGPKHLNLKLTRRDLNRITKGLVELLVEPCKNCLKDAKITKNEIDEVILVGGMTRMAAVREKVKEIFGKEPNKTINPDEAVAIGASIQAANLTGSMKSDILLLDVTPLSLGIETLNGVNVPIIARNTTIPIKKSQVFSTAIDNQPSVIIRVGQGEREFFADNKLLGTFELSGIKPAPRGVPQIEVTFNLDANGILKVTARDITDPQNPREQSITITNSQSLSKEEKEKAIELAEKFAEEDRKKRENLEELNKAQNYLDRFKEEIEKFKSNEKTKDSLELKNLQELCNNLEKAVNEKNYDEIKNQLKNIEEIIKISEQLKNKNTKEEEMKPEEKEDNKKDK